MRDDLPCCAGSRARCRLKANLGLAVRSAGMAKMLLGHVVDGPELDLIWSGFNPDDGDTVVDDEEHEKLRVLI